jgi:hypothetical protein
MPTTTSNIDKILRRCTEATREEIRDAIDEVQKIVYSQNSFQTMKIESTGMPPYLVTTQGVYEYDCPSDCRVAAAVFSIEQARGYQRSRVMGPRREYFYRGRGYVPANVEVRPATIENVAKVYFREDPGTTTEKYFLPYYIKPNDIGDENVQLVLPEHLHWRLREAVVAMLTSEEYGESERETKIMERTIKKIRGELNKGFGNIVGVTPIQPEYRSFPDTIPSYL